MRLLAARAGPVGVRPVRVPTDAQACVLSGGGATGTGATPPCGPARVLRLSWAGRLLALRIRGARRARGACGLGAVFSRRARSQGSGEGSERLRTVARSPSVVLVNAELNEWPDVGHDESQVAFLLCSQMPELFSDAYSLVALGGLPWGSPGHTRAF